MKTRILLYLTFITTAAFSQWNQINTPVIPTANSITDFEFIDDNTGFLGINNKFGIYHTTNAGVTWETYNSSQITFPVPIDTFTLVKFDFVDDITGFMTVRGNTVSGYHSYLFKTENSGNSWIYIRDFTSEDVDVNFFNADYGVVFRYYLYITKDGGQNWQTVNLSQTIYEVHIPDTNTICSMTSNGCFYSNNFGSSFTNTLPGFSFSQKKSSFIDSIGFAMNSNYLIKTFNNGLIWDTIGTGSYSSNTTIFPVSEDSIFFGQPLKIVLSKDSGLTWYEQPHSDMTGLVPSGSYYYWDYGDSYLYCAHRFKILRTSNLGGCITPNLVNTWPGLNKCPGASITITNPNDPSLLHYWSWKGNVVSTDNDLNWFAPSVYQGSSDLYFCAAFPSEGCFDSIAGNLYVYPNPIPPDITAEYMPFVNCTTKVEYVGIYPYWSSYSYYITADTLINYVQLTPPAYISGDTAFFTRDLKFNVNYTVKIQISNTCGSGSKTFPLIKTIEPFNYSDSYISLNKTIYCVTDTVRVTISETNPGTQYWIDLFTGSGVPINPVTATGDTIVLKFPTGIYNTSGFAVFFKSPLGCTYHSAKFNCPVETLWPYIYPPQIYHYTTETIQIIPYLAGTPKDSCFWHFSGESHDTSLSCLCDTLYLNLPYDGYWDVYYDYTTVNGCSYTSTNYPDALLVLEQGDFSDENYCSEKDGLDLKHVLDMEYDSSGNLYTAGYYLKSGILEGTMGTEVGAYYFRKYDSDDSLIWEKNYMQSHFDILPWEYYCSYGTCILPDDSGNVYVAGQMLNEDFQFDSVSYNASAYHYKYAFLAKLNADNGNTDWVMLYAPTTTSHYSVPDYPNYFSDISIVDNKIYVLGEFDDYGIIKRNISQNQWQNIYTTPTRGVILMQINSNGDVFEYNKIGICSEFYYLHITPYSSSYFGYSKNSYMKADKQNRLNIHWLSDAVNPIHAGDQYLSVPSNYLGTDKSLELFGVYDPDFGWVNTLLMGSYKNGRGSEYNFHNRLLFDSHGNKFICSNWSLEKTFYPVLNEYNGYLWGDYFPKSGSAVSKLDVNCNMLWYKMFNHCLVADVALSGNEEHLGVSILQDGNYFSWEGETGRFGLNENGNASAIYYQMTKNGDFESINKFGPDETIPLCLLEDTSGFLRHYTYTRNDNFAEYYIANDTIIFDTTAYGNIDSFNSYLIMGENDNCSGVAYSGGVSDTLFLHLNDSLEFCVNDTLFIPWVSTTGIDSVSLCYMLYNDTVKHLIATDLPANLFEYFWMANVPNASDSIKFLIYSSDSVYTDLTPYYKIHNNQFNLVTFEDTLLCPFDTFSIVANYPDYNYFWSPSSYFNNNYNDSVLLIPDYDTLNIILQAQNPFNQCYSLDTMQVVYNPDTTHAIIDFTVNDSTLQIINNSLNYTGYNFYINNLPATFDDTITGYYYQDSSVFYHLITYEECTFDTAHLIVNFSLAETCNGDSIEYFGNWYSNEGYYYNYTQTDTCILEHFYIDVHETYLTALPSESICLGDSILIFGNYISQPGIYFDSLLTIYNCDSIFSLELLVNDLPVFDLGNDTILCPNDQITLQVDSGFSSYLWTGGFDTHIIVLDTSWFDTSGYIVLNVTDSNGCVNTDSVFVLLDPCTFISETNDFDNIKIYPNPASNTLFFESGNIENIVKLELIDSRGRTLWTNNKVHNQMKIKVSSLSYGKYYIIVHTVNGNKAFGFIKTGR